MSTCNPSGSNTSANAKDNGAKKSGSGFLGLFCRGKPDVNKNKECVDKCPPMPCFNTGECKPAWLCEPPKLSTKTYPAPKGVKINPIGKGGRYGTPSESSRVSTCSSCGKIEENKKKKSPSVKNKDCPMMKPRCPNSNKENTEQKEPGMLSKISSFFGSKATAVTKLASYSKQEDSVIHHDSEVSNPTLVVRKDGYFCPLICDCAPSTPSVPKLPDLNCNCEDCKEQNACSACRKWAKDTIKSCDKSTDLNNNCFVPCKELVICRPEPQLSPPECTNESTECDCQCEEEICEDEEPLCEEDQPCAERTYEEEPVCEEEQPCAEPTYEEEPECEEEQPCVEMTYEKEPLGEKVLECDCCDEEPQNDTGCCCCGCIEEPSVPETCQQPPPTVICTEYCYEIPTLSFEEFASTPPVASKVQCNNPQVSEVVSTNPKVPVVVSTNRKVPEVVSTNPKVLGIECNNSNPEAQLDPRCPAIRKPTCGCSSPESKVNDPGNLTPPDGRCKPAYWDVPSGTQGPTGPCADDIPTFTSVSLSFQRPELETTFRETMSCLGPKDTAEILRILQRVPDKPAAPEIPTEVTVTMDVTAKAEEMLRTKCTCRLCSPPEVEPPDFLPDPDDRDVSVRAAELLETKCDCVKCNTLMSEDGEPCPDLYPNVTCGECGYIRGENTECCVMCKFSEAMKKEKQYMRNLLCIESSSLDSEEKVCEVKVDPENAEFEYVNGKPLYEGGMSINRTQKYLWAQGLCDGPGFKELAVQGQTLRGDTSEPECTCEEHMKKLKYKGGQTIDEVQEWLWIKNKNPTIEKLDDDEPIDK